MWALLSVFNANTNVLKIIKSFITYDCVASHEYQILLSYFFCLFSSDSDEKPLKGSLRSLNRDMQPTESADSLVEYGEGDHGLFSEDGSFIGAYAGSKEKGSVESNGSSTATFPLRA